jgi:hypothetical protein
MKADAGVKSEDATEAKKKLRKEGPELKLARFFD